MSIEFSKGVLAGPPITGRLRISDNVSVLARFNDEKTWIEFGLTRGFPAARVRKSTAITGMMAGTHSEWAYKQNESAVDGIVDFKLEDASNGETIDVIRIRNLRNMNFTKGWHRLKIGENFEVTLDKQPIVSVCAYNDAHTHFQTYDGSNYDVRTLHWQGLMRMNRCVLFDWGGTLMKDLPGLTGPMVGWPRVERIEGAPEVLAELHKTWILALATNAVNSSEEQIWAALRRVSLDCFLDKVYCFRTIGKKKPSSEFFAYVLNDLGLKPSSVFMVGDDFESDILGAVRCGIRSIWFNEQSDEKREAEMYRTVHDLKSLPEVLGMFESCHIPSS